MSTPLVLNLDDYRGRRRQRLGSALALLRPDVIRFGLGVRLARVLETVGADRAAVVWLDEDAEPVPHPHVVVDLYADRPRRAFDPALLRRAWELGIPGTVDQVEQAGTQDPDAPRVSACVALGSDGLRTWFAVVDSMTPRGPLDREARRELLFAAGESAALLLHRDLAESPESPGPAEGFTGWTVLGDLDREGAERSRVTRRFLILRMVRSLLDDDLVPDPEALASRLRALEPEIRTGDPDDEAPYWWAVMEAARTCDGLRLAEALVGLGLHAEELGELEGALEALRSGYWVAALVGERTLALDASRYLGRVYRKAGRWDESERWYRQAAHVAETVGDRAGHSVALDGLAHTLRARGNIPRARATLLGALELAREAADPYALGSVHQHLMTVHHLAGEREDAVHHGWASVQAYRSRRDRLRALVSLAGVLMDHGALDLAEEAYRVALEAVDEAYFRMFALEGFAHVSALHGDRNEYERRYQAVVEEGWSRGGVDFQAQAWLYRGRAYEALGDREAAESWYRRALAFAEESGLNAYVFQAEEALARLMESPPSDEAREPCPPVPSEALLEVRSGLGTLRRELAGSST